MKLLSKKILGISKFLLLCNLFVGGVHAQTLISSDRFLFKIIDRAISEKDVSFQARNLKALHCVYSDSLVISYFGKNFSKNISKFLQELPKDISAQPKYLRSHKEILTQLRLFYKMLRYSEDQNKRVPSNAIELIRESAQVNKCDSEVLYRDRLKTNFLSLLELEIYLKSRYEGQLKASRVQFSSIKPSIDLFVDTLDKQFTHEYYW